MFECIALILGDGRKVQKRSQPGSQNVKNGHRRKKISEREPKQTGGMTVKIVGSSMKSKVLLLLEKQAKHQLNGPQQVYGGKNASYCFTSTKLAGQAQRTRLMGHFKMLNG